MLSRSNSIPLSTTASIPLFACELKAVSPYRRGFMCGDPSITYPYLHREAIPDELLITGGIIITGLTVSNHHEAAPTFPIILGVAVIRPSWHVHFQIALGECYRVRFRGVSSKAFVRNLYVSSLYKELGCFLFGCGVGQSLTNMAKLSVGRLRPHFLSVCGVTYAALNCTPGTYVATVRCLQPDHRLEEEARCVDVYTLVLCIQLLQHYSKYLSNFIGSPSSLATPLLRCTQCSI